MTPGPSSIHNQILAHLPPTGMEFLLSIYNHLWTENLVRATCREAVVVPILKPGKDLSFITIY
jgi:hypothetical protein